MAIIFLGILGQIPNLVMKWKITNNLGVAVDDHFGTFVVKFKKIVFFCKFNLFEELLQKKFWNLVNSAQTPCILNAVLKLGPQFYPK